MQHRHLLPNEFDLLLDGEAGFGVVPLRAHIDECPACAAQLAESRLVCDALEALPHFAPTPRFADKVMAQVQVIEPWHVAILDTAQRLLPQSRPVRLVMAVTAVFSATTLSAAAVWLAFRADAALYFFNIMAGRARTALVNGTGSFIADTFGSGALDVIRSSGLAGIAVGAGVMLAAVGGATLGFRALATASRNRR
jgi:hypothetical protein